MRMMRSFSRVDIQQSEPRSSFTSSNRCSWNARLFRHPVRAIGSFDLALIRSGRRRHRYRSPRHPKKSPKWRVHRRLGRGTSRKTPNRESTGARPVVSKNQRLGQERLRVRKRRTNEDAREVDVKRSHQVACYVNDEELAELKAQVAKRGVTLSRYLKERALGNDQTDPCPQTGTSGTQNVALEVLLNESERRIAQQVATVTDKGTRDMLSRLSLLATMLDQFARTMLIHTPEIPHDQQKSAGESGERRHRNWRRMVAEILSDMDVSDNSEVESKILAQQTAEARL